MREYGVTVLRRSKVGLPFNPHSPRYLKLKANRIPAAFAECALGRTFTAPFKCRAQNRAMNSCMIAHATQAEQDAAREEWFANRLKRQVEREKKEERRKEQEKFHREWWGLPLEDREGEKGKDVMRRAERVGGFPKREKEGELSKDRHR
jgi:COX assembly mitochondrial protein 1